MNAKEVRAIRESRGLTQKEMAELVGVDTVTVNRWENGKSSPMRLAVKVLQGLVRRDPEPNPIDSVPKVKMQLVVSTPVRGFSKARQTGVNE